MAKRLRATRILRVMRPKFPKLPSTFPKQQKGPPSTKPATAYSADVAPADWQGTLPEYLVYIWLIRRGLREGIDFRYQVDVQGGRRMLFGAVADFIINAGPYAALTMIWRVQGYYWHFVANRETRANDALQRLRLEAAGWTVIDILDLDLEDPVLRDEVLRDALGGIERISLNPLVGRNEGDFNG